MKFGLSLYVCGQINHIDLSRYLYIAVFIIAILGAFSCAKIGSPLGGPKDEAPPKVIKTKPPANTVNFEPQKNIIIIFDEYIQVEDIFQEMIISPPLNDRITAQVKGKSLVVTFPKEAIFDTTTYTLDFGNSIVDHNEGNVLEGYRYVFSLKQYIDTMNVEGKIVNAFNHQPDKDRMNVMLYKNMNDSAPYLEKPDYICRTDVQGNFSMHNIENGHYRLFAVKDANLNMLYDLPNEQIAYSDSIIELTAERFQDSVIVSDTLFTNQYLIPDSINYNSRYNDDFNESDTLVSDSIMMDSLAERQLYYSFYTELFFFTEEIQNQYMTNYLRPVKEQLVLSFNEPLADTFEFYPLNYTPSAPDWFLLDANRNMDTLKFWITDTSMFAMDTLQMEACYPMYDSSGLMYNHVDTLLLKMEQETTGRMRRDRMRQPKEEAVQPVKEIPKIVLHNNIKNSGAFDLNQKIVLICQTPLSRVFTDSIQLFRIQDTLEIPVKIETAVDSNTMYKTYINYKPEESTTYKVLIPDSTIFDIYGATNDTTFFRFKTQAEDYYGALTINLNGVDTPLLLQLLDDKEKLLVERKIFSNESIRFDYLYPKKYFLKLIVDTNANGQWDTGNYLNHIQPEKVIYYPQVIDIRSNWEMDFIWDLESQH